MEARVLFVSALISVFLSGIQSATFTIRNSCPYTIYPAILTGSGSRAPTTGFQLASQASRQVTIPAPWSGRIWARFVCSNSGGRFSCRSGDCGTGQIPCNNRGGAPPTTLAEFTLGGDGGKDFYDVSLVDGFNLPVRIQPQGRSSCQTTDCPVDINAQCPSQLAVRNPDGGGVIGCKSACTAFNEPRYCCTGRYDSPSTCQPTNYSRFFESKCPKAYSYAYDDPNSTFTCPTGANYLITFCP